MQNSQLTLSSNQSVLYQKHHGFTIIELVLVIVLMGILSVTVAPKLFNSDGFQEYAYQAEVVNTLRNIQLKAMQQTDGNTCHVVNISAKELSITSLCGTPTETELEDEKQAKFVPEVVIDSQDSISFQLTGVSTSFSFDSLGRPVNCLSPCQVILQGSETLTVQIESEGFVHAL